MFSATGFSSQNYMVLPAPRFMNSPSTLNYTVSFSGIAQLGLKGKQDGSWNRDTLSIAAIEMKMNKVLERVIPNLPPLPAGTNDWALVPLQWTINAGVNSEYEKNDSPNTAFSVDDFKVFHHTVSANQNNTSQITVLGGLQANLAVKNKDAIIWRVGYLLELYGYFVPCYFAPIG